MEKVVSAKNNFSGTGALMCVTWERYGPRCAVKGALHNGVNISVCDNNSKWSVFSDQVTYSAHVMKTCVGAYIIEGSRTRVD